jgi:hypothetical protein
MCLFLICRNIMEPDEADPRINLEDDDAEFREHAPQPTRNISGLLDEEEQPEACLSERRELDNQFLAEREAREAASGDRLSHIEQKYAPSRSPASIAVSRVRPLLRHHPIVGCTIPGWALLAPKLEAVRL